MPLDISSITSLVSEPMVEETGDSSVGITEATLLSVRLIWCLAYSSLSLVKIGDTWDARDRGGGDGEGKVLAEEVSS